MLPAPKRKLLIGTAGGELNALHPQDSGMYLMCRVLRHLNGFLAIRPCVRLFCKSNRRCICQGLIWIGLFSPAATAESKTCRTNDEPNSQGFCVAPKAVGRNDGVHKQSKPVVVKTSGSLPTWRRDRYSQADIKHHNNNRPSVLIFL